MAYGWSILRAAVEQEIAFPSREIFENYVNSLKKKGISHEIIFEQVNPDGTCIVKIRKPYNNNRFLPSIKEE